MNREFTPYAQERLSGGDIRASAFHLGLFEKLA